MSSTTTDDSSQSHSMDEGKVGADELFAIHKDRLKRAIAVRLDRRLATRIDCDDILQEVFLELYRRFSEFQAHPTVSFYLWARTIALQILVDSHRKHLGALKRDPRREITLSETEFAELADSSLTPSGELRRSESWGEVVLALERMDSLNREILLLRHFELLSNQDAAAVLGIEPAAASQRYLRALQRLRSLLS